jgi:hypothetical protein
MNGQRDLRLELTSDGVDSRSRRERDRWHGPVLGRSRTVNFVTDMAAKPIIDRFPFYGPAINEGLELWKNSEAANQLHGQLNGKNP